MQNIMIVLLQGCFAYVLITMCPEELFTNLITAFNEIYALKKGNRELSYEKAASQRSYRLVLKTNRWTENRTLYLHNEQQ
jgi:hypothetical protein